MSLTKNYAAFCVGVESEEQIDREGRRPWFDRVIQGFGKAYLDAGMCFEVVLVEFVSAASNDNNLISEALAVLDERYPGKKFELILCYSLRELAHESSDIWGCTVEYNHCYLGDTVGRGVNSDIKYATHLAVHETGHRWVTANRLELHEAEIYSLMQHHYPDDDLDCVMAPDRGSVFFVRYPSRISLSWRRGAEPRFCDYCKMLLPSKSAMLPARIFWRKRPEVKYSVTPVDLKDCYSWGEPVASSPLFEQPPLTVEDADRIAMEQLISWFPSIAEAEYPPRVVRVSESLPPKFGVFVWWRLKKEDPYSVGSAIVDVSDMGYVLGVRASREERLFPK